MHKPQRYSLINLAESIRRGGDIKAAKYERGLSGMILDLYETAHGRPGAAPFPPLRCSVILRSVPSMVVAL